MARSPEVALRGYVDELAGAPRGDVLAVKKLRAQITRCLKEVLKQSLSTDSAERLWAFTLSTELCQGNAEIACLVAKTGLLEMSLVSNLEIQDHCQQEILLHALSLASCVAEHVPESSVFGLLVPLLLAVAADTWPGAAPFRAPQVAALHTLVHLGYSRVSWAWLAKEMSEAKVVSILEAAQRPDAREQPVAEHLFAAALLVGNLCNVSVGQCTCAYLAQDFWEDQDFFLSLAPALAASLRGEPWPPNSATVWPAWKLAHTVQRLAENGYALELRMSVAPLATLVVRKVKEEPERARRLAMEAMRSIASAAAADVEQLRRDVAAAAPSLQLALRDLSEENPAAADLAEVLRGRDPLPFLHTDLT